RTAEIVQKQYRTRDDRGLTSKKRQPATGLARHYQLRVRPGNAVSCAQRSAIGSVDLPQIAGPQQRLHRSTLVSPIVARPAPAFPELCAGIERLRGAVVGGHFK